MEVFAGGMEKLDVLHETLVQLLLQLQAILLFPFQLLHASFLILSAWLSRAGDQSRTLTCLILPLARRWWRAASHDKPQGR